MRRILLFSVLFLSFVALEAQWTSQSTNFSGQSVGVRNISIVSDDVVWISAYDGSGNNANLQMYSKTSDGGNTWASGAIDVGNTALGIAMVHAIDENNAWAVAYPNAAFQIGGVYRTSDGGTTWNKQTTAPFSDANSFANVVYMDASGQGFCQGDPIDGYFELYTTSDFGENWARVPSANIPAPLSGEYGYVGQIFTAGNSIWFTTNKGRIFRSTDMGMNWTVAQSPISDFGGESSSGNLAFADDNYGLLVDNNGNLYSSSNGGVNWSSLSFTGTLYGAGLDFIDGTQTVVSTGSASGASGSSYSTDGGQTWTSLDTDVQHTNVAFNENGVGWAGGFTDQLGAEGIFKYTGASLGLTNNTALSQEVTVYPNPTNGIITISTDKEVKAVSIYSVLGRKLKTVSSTATVNLSSLAKGTYILEVINTDGSIEHIKVMKK